MKTTLTLTLLVAAASPAVAGSPDESQAAHQVELEAPRGSDAADRSPGDAHGGRAGFMPSALTLRSGEVRLRMDYGVVPGLAFGLGDRIQVGVRGVIPVPGKLISGTTDVTIRLFDGDLLKIAGLAKHSEVRAGDNHYKVRATNFGGVATLCISQDCESSFSLGGTGGTLQLSGHDLAGRYLPLFSAHAAAVVRISNHVKAFSEVTLLTVKPGTASAHPALAGMRLHGEQTTVDVGVIVPSSLGADHGFYAMPVLPYVSLSFRLGGRKA